MNIDKLKIWKAGVSIILAIKLVLYLGGAVACFYMYQTHKYKDEPIHRMEDLVHGYQQLKNSGALKHLIESESTQARALSNMLKDAVWIMFYCSFLTIILSISIYGMNREQNKRK